MCTSSHGRNYASSCVLRDTHTHTHRQPRIVAGLVLERCSWAVPGKPRIIGFVVVRLSLRFELSSRVREWSNFPSLPLLRRPRMEKEELLPKGGQTRFFSRCCCVINSNGISALAWIGWSFDGFAHEISVVYCIFFIYFFFGLIYYHPYLN